MKVKGRLKQSHSGRPCGPRCICVETTFLIVFQHKNVVQSRTALIECLLYQHWVHLFLLFDFSRDLITKFWNWITFTSLMYLPFLKFYFSSLPLLCWFCARVVPKPNTAESKLSQQMTANWMLGFVQIQILQIWVNWNKTNWDCDFNIIYCGAVKKTQTPRYLSPSTSGVLFFFCSTHE